MSSWAPKLAENVAKARDRCIEQLNGLARQVACALDDMKGRDWIFDLDTHPYDRIDAAMTWAEGLVRRVILARVAQLREETSDHDRRFPRRWEPMLRPENAERSQHRFPSAPESAVHQSVPERALCEQTENSWAPDSSASGVSPDLQDSLRNPGLSTAQDRDPDSNQNCPFEGSHHKPYSPPEPSFKYRPTFRWTEARSVPGVPSGQRSITRQKPRKYDMRTKVEAKLALYRHMLENADAYAKRLAHRLETRSLVIPAGKPGPSREDDRTSKSDDPSEGCDPGPSLPKSTDVEDTAWTPACAGVSGESGQSAASDTDPGAAGGQNQRPPPHPILSWQLYSTPPPGGDDLRTDLIALHMAYEAG